MKSWQIGIILLLTIILFGQYIFNPMLAGADTWFYVNQICEISEHDVRDPVFDMLTPFMPCDFLFLKVYLAALFFIMLFFTAKIGELYDKENGWLLALIVGFFTLFSLEYIVFENDSLGFTLFFIALFFVLRAFKEKKKMLSIDNGMGLIFILLAGLCWKGAVYWLFVFVILCPIFIIPLFGILIVYSGGLFWFIGATTEVQEQTPWLGIMYLGLTPLFLFGLVKMSKKEALICVLMLIPLIFVQKLYVLAIPFIAIVALMGILSIKKYKDTIIMTIIIFSFFMAAFWGMHTNQEFPTVQDFVVVQRAAQDVNYVENAFGIGYIAIYNGLEVSSFGGTDGNDFICNGYVLSHTWLNDCNYCTTIEKGPNIVLYDC